MTGRSEVTESLLKLFERDLRRLENEISLFDTEESLWKIGGEIRNPAGNLALHLCGNLRYYVGNVLGKTGYVRNREHEFAARNIPKNDLLAAIKDTIGQVLETISALDAAELEKEYPEDVFGYPMTTMYFLIHLHGHLNYHYGQINYVRRLTKTV